MLNKILSLACTQENCPVRCGLSKHAKFLVRVHTVLSTLITFLIGIFIGSMLLYHHAVGQDFNKFKQQQESGKVIELSVQVSMMSGILQTLSSKLDQVKSEADTTQAMAAGIGIAIMFLQLLGFFVKSKSEK